MVHFTCADVIHNILREFWWQPIETFIIFVQTGESLVNDRISKHHKSNDAVCKSKTCQTLYNSLKLCDLENIETQNVLFQNTLKTKEKRMKMLSLTLIIGNFINEFRLKLREICSSMFIYLECMHSFHSHVQCGHTTASR